MLSVFSIEESEKWDQIVKDFKSYDVYYLSNYTKAFQIHGDGQPILFYYEDGDIKAINVVMKRDISQDSRFAGKLATNTYYDLTTPYGYGGFLIEGKVNDNSLQSLNYEYSAKCKSEGIISEFVRFHPILKNEGCLQGMYDISLLGKTITVNLNSQNQVWNNLTSKNRNVIRKAKKSGVEIFWGRSAELYSEFKDIYNATMDKDNANEYYYFGEDFYKSVLSDLKNNSLLFYGVYSNKIISMAIIMFANEQMHYHLSASDRKYQHLAPTNLLLYEAACWGLEIGVKSLHLGGGLGSKEDSLYKFKKAFNKESNTSFAIGRKIFDEEKYNELTNIRSKEESYDNATLFFPSYRG